MTPMATRMVDPSVYLGKSCLFVPVEKSGILVLVPSHIDKILIGERLICALFPYPFMFW